MYTLQISTGSGMGKPRRGRATAASLDEAVGKAEKLFPYLYRSTPIVVYETGRPEKCWHLWRKEDDSTELVPLFIGCISGKEVFTDDYVRKCRESAVHPAEDLSVGSDLPGTIGGWPAI
jgi:hypothetical protein